MYEPCPSVALVAAARERCILQSRGFGRSGIATSRRERYTAAYGVDRHHRPCLACSEVGYAPSHDSARIDPVFNACTSVHRPRAGGEKRR